MIFLKTRFCFLKIHFIQAGIVAFTIDLKKWQMTWHIIDIQKLISQNPLMSNWGLNHDCVRLSYFSHSCNWPTFKLTYWWQIGGSADGTCISFILHIPRSIAVWGSLLINVRFYTTCSLHYFHILHSSKPQCFPNVQWRENWWNSQLSLGISPVTFLILPD